MKKLFYLFGICCSFIFISCEEDIALDFDETVPRLVIEANIFEEEDLVRIILSTTTNFYSDVFPKVDGAEVQIKNLETNEIYMFMNSGAGNYITSNIDFQNGISYELTVIYNNESYKAVSTPLKAPEVINIGQINDGGILGDSYEFQFYFQDNPDQENYYLTQAISPIDHSFGVLNDEFTNGNLMNDVYFYDKEDLKSGDRLDYFINSIDKNYYNYLSKLFSISGSGSNPFASPMGTIKGNIINQTKEDNYALGYFHIAKRNHYTYIVK